MQARGCERMLDPRDQKPDTGIAHLHQLQPLPETYQAWMDLRQSKMCKNDKYVVAYY